ncbi:MAG: hypothetical protein J1F60_10150 [Oscillospiraceae bacterium]|nr:hypothetical protein [Oscillospiraceae bacterium]
MGAFGGLPPNEVRLCPQSDGFLWIAIRRTSLSAPAERCRIAEMAILCRQAAVLFACEKL